MALSKAFIALRKGQGLDSPRRQRHNPKQLHNAEQALPAPGTPVASSPKPPESPPPSAAARGRVESVPCPAVVLLALYPPLPTDAKNPPIPIVTKEQYRAYLHGLVFSHPGFWKIIASYI